MGSKPRGRVWPLRITPSLSHLPPRGGERLLEREERTQSKVRIKTLTQLLKEEGGNPTLTHHRKNREGRAREPAGKILERWGIQRQLCCFAGGPIGKKLLAC
jgi:hypothetical protein